MKKLELQVSFVTPAFLGNAEQQGQWRTPPFKALLRQWWRVAVAKDCDFDVGELRKRELELFGSAADDKTGGKSKVRIRLQAWPKGNFTGQLKDSKVTHPEVKFPVGSALYLGYGPIGYKKGKGTVVNMSNAIAPSDSNALKLGFPAGKCLEESAQLSAWFGTLGSRSRNGWGSCQFRGKEIESIGALLHGSGICREILQNVSRPLVDCLQLEWPHAIGTDAQGLLIWKTQAFDDWQQVMKLLAEVKIAFRTNLNVNGGFQDRHLLAYPVTHHGTELGNQTRIANQIRFKVVCSRNKYFGLVFHLPCDIPSALKSKLKQPPSIEKQLRIWQQVHQILDKKDNQMHRLGGAS